MELTWELNALEETDVVSLVLLFVIRCVGDILVSYLSAYNFGRIAR